MSRVTLQYKSWHDGEWYFMAQQHDLKLWQSTLGRFRIIALAEGVSYVLLLAAMPLKYGLDMPLGVKIMGRIHGVLFVFYVMALIGVWAAQRWPIQRAVLAFVASVVPLGAFWFETKLKEETPREALKLAGGERAGE